MPLRAQYITDVGLNVNPYPNNPGPRVAGMYQTARRGRIAQALANQIWQRHLLPIHGRVQAGTLPNSQSAYDQLVIDTALSIQNTLQVKNRGGFGIGQKIVNLFMKDLCALNQIVASYEYLMNVPLDDIMLGKLQKRPPTWRAWTKVVANGPNAPEIADYVAIQQQFRAFQAGSPIAFPSVIQMEQFIWHRI